MHTSRRKKSLMSFTASPEKPAFLSNRRNATQYGLDACRLSYQFRMPYTWTCFQHLYDQVDTLADTLTSPSSPAILDVGCGMGDVAIPMAMKYRVDAVDISENMINLGRLRPGGNNSRLRWLHTEIEKAPLENTYLAITAGDSMHWLDWKTIFPLFQTCLHPQGKLNLLCRYYAHLPWKADLRLLEKQYHTVSNVERYNTVELLEEHGYWKKEGFIQTPTEPLAYRVDDYIEAMHSRNGFTRDLMSLDDQHAFDHALREIILPFVSEDQKLHVGTYSTLTWGEVCR